MLGIEFAMIIIDLSVSNLLFVLLSCFYVGITTWYRFVLDTITGGNFLMCPSLDAFNAMRNLVGTPPLMINETTLTLKHVMERLDAMEKKMLTEDHMGICRVVGATYANGWLIIVDSSFSIACTPENEVLNFKQREVKI